MKRVSLLVTVLVVAGVVLSACGGAAAADPAGVTKDAMQAVVDKNFTKLADLTCAAQKSNVQNMFNPAGQLAQLGIDTQQLLDSMSFSLQNAEYTKVSENGDKAVVTVKGKLAIKVDKDKFKTVMKAIAQAQGQTLTDDQLDQVLTPMLTQFEAGTDLNQNLDLVKENGKWVLCPSN